MGPWEQAFAALVNAIRKAATPPPVTEGKPKMAWRGRPLTGPVETGYWGVGATDLGICREITPGGEILTVFGDTFSGGRVGEGDWRSPCGLIGTKGPDGHPVYNRAASPDPNYARQFWAYPHNNPTFSTVLPTDVVRLPDGALILHVMVVGHGGLANTRWTELWRSTDNGRTWGHLGLKFGADWDAGRRRMWTMELGDDGFVYIMSTGWRDRGIIMYRVHWTGMNNFSNYQPWRWTSAQGWHWGVDGQPAGEILPGKWGELNLRKVSGKWVLTGFNATNGRVETRVVEKPWSNLHTAPVTTIVRPAAWTQDGQGDLCAQPYGGYVVPGSVLGVTNGFKVAVSQWNTDDSPAGPRGWPYRVMGYTGTVPNRT